MIEYVHYDSVEKSIVYSIEKVTISSVHFVIDSRERVATITSVSTIKPFRKQGYATLLLKILIKDLKREGYQYIYLDDDSDHYRKPHNIYVDLGWRYIHNWGPEMTLTL